MPLTRFWGLSICAQCNLFAVATRQSLNPPPCPLPPTANRISTINIYHVTTQISHTVECVTMCVCVRVCELVCVLSQVHFSFYRCGMLATHLPHSAATSRANKCACIAKAFCTRNQPQMHHVARDFNLCSTFACSQRN